MPPVLDSLHILEGHTDIVQHMMEVNDKTVASAGHDGKIIFWNIQGCYRSHLVAAHSLPVTALIKLTGCDTLMSSSANKQLCLWDCNTGRCIKQISGVGTFKVLLELRCGLVVAAESSRLWLWSRAGEQRAQAEAISSNIDISHIVEIAGSKIVVAAGKSLGVYAVVDLEEGGDLTLLRRLPDPRESVTALSPVGPDAASLACGCCDGVVQLWSSRTFTPGRLLRVLPRGVTDYKGKTNDYPYSVQLLRPFGQYLVVAAGRSIHGFDTMSGSEVFNIPDAHLCKIQDLDFCFGGHVLVTGGDDGLVKMWHVTIRDKRQQPEVTRQSGGSSAPADDYIATFMSCSCQELKRLSSPASPTLLRDLTGHAGPLKRVMWMEGCSSLVTCGADSLVLCWTGRVDSICRKLQLLSGTS